MAEDLKRHQAVPGGERDQLGTNLVPLGSQARAVKGLHEYAVQSEGQQGRVAQARALDAAATASSNRQASTASGACRSA